MVQEHIANPNHKYHHYDLCPSKLHVNTYAHGSFDEATICTYRRSGFECEILLIMNCKFLYKTQSLKKIAGKEEYTMNNNT